MSHWTHISRIRYSPVAEADPSDDGEVANINNLEEYIELLYEEGAAKVGTDEFILLLNTT